MKKMMDHAGSSTTPLGPAYAQPNPTASEITKSPPYHHWGTSGYFFISTMGSDSERPREDGRTEIMGIVDILSMATLQETQSTKGCSQLLPVPEEYGGHSRAKTKVISEL